MASDSCHIFRRSLRRQTSWNRLLTRILPKYISLNDANTHPQEVLRCVQEGAWRGSDMGSSLPTEPNRAVKEREQTVKEHLPPLSWSLLVLWWSSGLPCSSWLQGEVGITAWGSGMQAIQALTPSIPWDILMQAFPVRVNLSLCSRLWHLPSYKRGCSSIFKWNLRRVCWVRETIQKWPWNTGKYWKNQAMCW